MLGLCAGLSRFNKSLKTYPDIGPDVFALLSIIDRGWVELSLVIATHLFKLCTQYLIPIFKKVKVYVYGLEQQPPSVTLHSSHGGTCSFHSHLNPLGSIQMADGYFLHYT